MATWKKLVVSGSDISQLNNDAGYITSVTAQHAFVTASINGVDLLADSSQGTFNIVTGSSGTGLTITGTAGTDTISFDLSAIPNSTLENDSVHISGSGISLASVALGATASIDVQVDDSTIEISADSLQLKDGGVTFAKLADALVVTSGEGIAGNDNDTTIATNAAIIDFVESASAAAGALSVGGNGSTSTTVDLDTQTFSFTGEAGVVAASASAQTMTISLVDGGVANAKLTNDSITFGSDAVALGDTVTQLSVTGITGSLSATSTLADGVTATTQTSDDNSTKVATTAYVDGALSSFSSTLDVSGSDGSGISIDLKTQDLTVGGTANEIETTTSGQTVTIGLPDDVTITQDLTVNRNLTVVGTASFQHTENLEVADRFIRLASGSNTEGDGGIVIQQSSDGTGDVFGFDGVSSDRWAVAQNFDGSDSAFTPEAFMAVVLTGSANTATAIATAAGTRYNKAGNIWTETGGDNDIWIYS